MKPEDRARLITALEEYRSALYGVEDSVIELERAADGGTYLDVAAASSRASVKESELFMARAALVKTVREIEDSQSVNVGKHV